MLDIITTLATKARNSRPVRGAQDVIFDRIRDIKDRTRVLDMRDHVNFEIGFGPWRSRSPNRCQTAAASHHDGPVVLDLLLLNDPDRTKKHGCNKNCKNY